MQSSSHASSRDTGGGVQPKHPTAQATENPAKSYDDDNTADLMARFSALRPSNASSASVATSPPRSDPAASDPFAFLGLPSVPDAEPTLPDVPDTQPEASHPTLGPAHSDIPADRDLDPFRTLVGRDLDVNRLGEVGPANLQGKSGKKGKDPYVSILPSPPRSDDDDADAGGDEVCSICTNDASLACFSPLDPMDGCAGDMYCSECWVEGHARMDRDELKEHRTRDVIPARARGQRCQRGGKPSVRKRAMAA